MRSASLGDQLERGAIGVAVGLVLEQQLRVAEHGGQRVVDLVRDLRRHHADRREPIAARERGLQLGALGDPLRHLVDRWPSTPISPGPSTGAPVGRCARRRSRRRGAASVGERPGQPGREERAERERERERGAADDRGVARGAARERVGLALGLLVEDRPAHAAQRLVARQVAVRADPAVRRQRALDRRRERAIDRGIAAGERRLRPTTRAPASLRRDRHAGAVDDEDARAGAEPRRRDHVAHEAEVELGDEDADQLAGAAARLDDQRAPAGAPSDEARRRRCSRRSCASRCRRSAAPGRRSSSLPSGSRIETRLDDRHLAPQPRGAAAAVSRGIARARRPTCDAASSSVRRASCSVPSSDAPSARMCARVPRTTSLSTSSRARRIASTPTTTVGTTAASASTSSTRQRSEPAHGSRLRSPAQAASPAAAHACDRLLGRRVAATTAASAGLRSSNSSGVSGARGSGSRRAQRLVDVADERAALRRARRGGVGTVANRSANVRLDVDARSARAASRQPRPGASRSAARRAAGRRAARARARDTASRSRSRERADLPRPGDPVRDLVPRPAPDLVGRFAARRRRRRRERRRTARRTVASARTAPGVVDAVPRSRAARRAATARTSSRRRARRADAAGPACARRAPPRPDRRSRRSPAPALPSSRITTSPSTVCGSRSQRAVVARRAPRASGSQSSAASSAGAVCKQAAATGRAARSRRCGSDRGSSVPRAQDLADHCWPRANGTSDDSTAIPRSATRVEQLGLLGPERVEEPDRRAARASHRAPQRSEQARAPSDARRVTRS